MVCTSMAAVPAGGLIRKVLASELDCVREHLLRLDSDARHRRFGHDVSDSYIRDYATTAVSPRNLTFGYFLDGHLRAIAELRRPKMAWGSTGEGAFSVEREFANRGLATILMGRVIEAARNRGMRHLLLYCMADNTKMRAIAQHYSAELRLEDGAVIADIVPRRLDYVSVVQEMIEDRFAIAHSVLDMQTRFLGGEIFNPLNSLR